MSLLLQKNIVFNPGQLMLHQASASELTQTRTRIRLPHNVDLVTDCICVDVLVPMPCPQRVSRIHYLQIQREEMHKIQS